MAASASADDLPPEIERLWEAPQGEWGVDQWREYAHWLQSTYVNSVENLRKTVADLERTTGRVAELTNRCLRLETFIGGGPATLENTLARQVDTSEAFLRQHLARPTVREAFIRLRKARDPAVADWRGRVPAHKGEIAFKLQRKENGNRVSTVHRRKRGAPEKPDAFAARLLGLIDIKRSTAGPRLSVRKMVRNFIDANLKGHAEHIRNDEFRLLYQQVKDARKKAQRKLGNKLS